MLVVALAILAELTLGRAGGAPDFALFLGRFHPLIVHLPIGFFLLVALAEAATFHPRLRSRVEPALGLLVPLSAIAALAAFLMGQLLALEGGFPAGALGWHRRLTLLALIGMAACWVLFERQHQKDGRGRAAYRGVLGLTLGLLSLGAHFGGTMTRGESYLSKYAPGPLKPLLGTPEPENPGKSTLAPAAPGAEPLVYRDVIQPLLTKYCVDCHGAEKQKGKLRLDSLELVLKGGEDGPAVVAGAPSKSLLVTRMLLPLGDDDHMPPKDEPSPPPEAVELLEFWIERGASPSLKVRDALPPATTRALLEHSLNAPRADSVPASAPAAATATSTSMSTPTAAAAEPSKTEQTAPQRAEAEKAPAAVAEPAPSDAGAGSGPAVLATYCEKCHGAAKQKGKLRVDSVAALVKGGANGSALVPGSPEQSPIVKRIRLGLSNDEHMPPAKEPQPSAVELAKLVSWIRGGASVTSSRVAAKTASGSSASPVSSNVPTPTPAAPAAPTPSASAPHAAPASTPPAPANAEVLASLPERVALFHEAVQPILREKCGKCHIRQSPAGGLGVEQHAQLLEGGFSGPGVVPKNREASLLMQRLVLPMSDGDHMPPDGEPALSADEIELIGAWIDQGAPAQEPTASAKLSSGAARALSARGVKRGPEPLAAQAGGCAACSVPGAPQSKWLGLQGCALAVAAAALGARRSRRAH